MIVLAHVGHWLEALPFVTPALVIPAGLAALVLIERRRDPGARP